MSNQEIFVIISNNNVKRSDDEPIFGMNLFAAVSEFKQNLSVLGFGYKTIAGNVVDYHHYSKSRSDKTSHILLNSLQNKQDLFSRLNTDEYLDKQKQIQTGIVFKLTDIHSIVPVGIKSDSEDPDWSPMPANVGVVDGYETEDLKLIAVEPEHRLETFISILDQLDLMLGEDKSVGLEINGILCFSETFVIDFIVMQPTKIELYRNIASVSIANQDRSGDMKTIVQFQYLLNN